jgi:acyl transferase domain-containing protein
MTGTPVGDPIEYESVRKTLVTPERRTPVHIGSVKDAIGHCEGASGIAGLLKVLLMLQHRALPKQANFISRNPRLPEQDKHLIDIVSKHQPWSDARLMALVNNYGAGGNNAAILIEEAPRPFAMQMRKPEITAMDSVKVKRPIVVTGKTAEAIVNYCRALHKFLTASDSKVTLRTLTDAIARRQNPAHEFIWCATTSSVGEIATLASKVNESNVLKKSGVSPKQVVLCFPGQNGRKVSIDEEFLRSNSLFERHMVSSSRHAPFIKQV